MIRCPNCGESNDPGSRFCFNCGANLAAYEPAPQQPPEPHRDAPPDQPPPPPVFPPAPGFPAADQVAEGRYPPDQPAQEPRPSIPPQYQPPAYGGGQPYGQSGGWGSPPPTQRSGWATIDELDPPPPPKRRATWLMVMLGLVAGCLLVCVGTFIFALTPPGQDTFEELGTVVAEFATEAAPEPTREP